MNAFSKFPRLQNQAAAGIDSHLGNVRTDGMINVLNQFAASRSRHSAMSGLCYNPDLIYCTDGLAQTIIDKPAEDAMSSGFKIEGDENEDVLNEFDRLDAIPVITDTFRWMRLHGGGVILVFVDDGLPLTEPLDYERINSVADLIDYPASAMTTTGYTYTDSSKKNYGYPAIYQIQPRSGQAFLVHESRLIMVPGDPLPPSMIMNRVLPWVGRSALDACYADLCRYQDGLKLTKGILERKVQLVHKMSDLGKSLAEGQDEIVAKRLNIADSVRGVFNMLAVDAADDIILADTALSGIFDVDRINRIALCASSRLPGAILFGEGAQGLNASSEGEQSIYHSLLNGMRARRLVPIIERLAGIIWAQKALPRQEPQRWRVQLGPLFSPKAAEVADTEAKRAAARKTSMEALSVAVDLQLITPEEGRQAVADIYPELNIDVTNFNFRMPDDIDENGESGEADNNANEVDG